jgi:ubiquinone biosynthesis protein Coq4
VISALESWPEWYHTHITPVPEYYYRQSRFLLDILQFLHETLSGNATMTSQLNDILQYHSVIERIAFSTENAPIVSEKFNSDVLALMHHLVDGKPLPNETLQPITYLFWKSNGKIIARRLTPALAELLGIPQN